jgi:hypothetical protein
LWDKREPEFVGEVVQVSAFASEELFFTLGEAAKMDSS